MAYEGKIKIDPQIDMSKIRKQIAELTKAMKIDAQINTSVAQRQIAQLTDAIKGMNKSLSGGKSSASDFGNALKSMFSSTGKSAAGFFDKIAKAGLEDASIFSELGSKVVGSLGNMSDTAKLFATGGIGVAIEAVGTLVPLLFDMIGSMDGSKERTEALKSSMAEMGGAMQGFMDGIASADSYLDQFPDAAAFNENQNKLQADIEENQQRIADIYAAAAEENRQLTEEEVLRVGWANERLLALQSEAAAEELDIAQAKGESVAAVAMADAGRRDMSLEEYAASAQRWIATAQEQADKEKELAEARVMAEITAAQAQRDAGVLSEEALTSLTQSKLALLDEEKEGIDRRIGDITAAYTDGYAEIAESNGIMLGGEAKKVEELARLAEEHQKKMDILRSDVDGNGAVASDQMAAEELAFENEKKLIEEKYAGSEEAYTAHFLSMTALTELHGGELSEESQAVADGIMAGYEDMPEDARQTMKDTMAPMLEEMENSEPLLYAKALTIGGGIIKKLKEALEVKSPSRATRRIFNAVMEGAKLGLADEEAALAAQSERIGEGVKAAFGKAGAETARRGYRQLETYMDALPISLQHNVAPGAMPGGRGTENHYDIHLTQNITSPKALSEAELTREAQDFISRMKWRLP